MRKFAFAFACAVSSLQTAPRRCSKARRRHATPDDDDNAKWSVDVDEFAERIESAKAAVVGGLAASVAAAPSAQIMICTPSMRRLLDGVAVYPTHWLICAQASPAEFLTHTNNIAQFEFDVDQISIMGALFGLVYRYAVRRDNNPQLRQGVVGAFAITRAVATVRVSDECLAVPLRCGPPLSYLDYAMLGQLVSGLLVSGVAFTAAAAAVDAGVDRGWLKRFP